MTPGQLRDAARNLAYGLGIPVYIRDGRIYQDGPGLAFLPPNGDPAVAEEAPSTWRVLPRLREQIGVSSRVG
jgi:hypothetical protein